MKKKYLILFLISLLCFIGNVKADKYIGWRLGDENEGWVKDLNRERHDTITIGETTYNYDKEETDLRAEFAESIKAHGVIQPIIVKKSIHGYELVAGENIINITMQNTDGTVKAIIAFAASSHSTIGRPILIALR